MTRWYRAYAGTVKDDKLAEVSIVACCSRSVAIAVWHAVLESAAETDDAGRFETTARRVAATLGEPAAVIEAAFAAMAEIGMLEGNAVAAWKRRQYESDNSTERSRKHRERKRDVNATLQRRSATPPDTEAETDSENKDPGKPASLVAGQPEIDLEDAERRCVEAAGSDRLGSFGPVAEILLSGKIDIDDALIAIRARPARNGAVSSWKFYAKILADKIAARAPSAPSAVEQVFIARDSPGWQERCMASGHKPSMTTQHPKTKIDGWWFKAPARSIEAAA